MKSLFRVFLMVALFALVVLALSACQQAPVAQASQIGLMYPAQQEPAPPLSNDDLLAAGVIAWAAGAVLSYILNTWSAAKTAFDNIPGTVKPYALAVFFVVVAGGLALANCNNIYSSAVTCPADANDWVKLIFLAGVAYGGSQWAHLSGGGKAAAAAATYKAMAQAQAPKA